LELFAAETIWYAKCLGITQTGSCTQSQAFHKSHNIMALSDWHSLVAW
jgi:hypothetical protein